jgi:hypothetical protein
MTVTCILWTVCLILILLFISQPWLHFPFELYFLCLGIKVVIFTHIQSAFFATILTHWQWNTEKNVPAGFTYGCPSGHMSQITNLRIDILDVWYWRKQHNFVSHFSVIKNWRAVFDISVENLFVLFTRLSVTHEVFITLRECVTQK